MNRAALDARTQSLVARSARQRDELAVALTPWRARAQKTDGAMQRVRAHRGLLGFLAGVGAGLLVALRPRWLLPSPRVLATLWPVWRLMRRQRERRTTQA